MRITRGWDSFARTEHCRLQIDVTGRSPADALRMVLSHADNLAALEGGDAAEALRAWANEDKVAKLAERRDRWRKRADDAELHRDAYVSAHHDMISELQETCNRADALRVEVENLRSELAEVKAHRDKAASNVVDAAESIAELRAELAEAKATAEFRRTAGEALSTSNRVLMEKLHYANQAANDAAAAATKLSVRLAESRDLEKKAQAEISKLRAELKQSLIIYAPSAGVPFDPNPTPTPGSEVERLLREILAAAECIRLGLRLSRDG